MIFRMRNFPLQARRDDNLKCLPPYRQTNLSEVNTQK